jgi:hypothetical protein
MTPGRTDRQLPNSAKAAISIIKTVLRTANVR